MTRKNYSPPLNISAPYREYRKVLKNPVQEYMKERERANRRINDTVKYLKENGYHLKKDVFIPQYIGFSERSMHEVGKGRFVFYVKDGYSMMRNEHQSWMLVYPDMKANVLLKIPNMFSAITILESLGLDVNVKDYLAGKWFK